MAGAWSNGRLLEVLHAGCQRASKDGGYLMREGEASAVGRRWQNSCMEKRERRSAVVGFPVCVQCQRDSGQWLPGSTGCVPTA